MKSLTVSLDVISSLSESLVLYTLLNPSVRRSVSPSVVLFGCLRTVLITAPIHS